jgi:hypothetical protein
MDSTREPRFEPTAPTDTVTDDAVVAYLRTRAPGLPTARFDARAITSRARRAVRRWRRLRNSAVAMACVATVYLALALAGPLPIPGRGPVSVPGSQGLRAAVARFLPGQPPGPDQWRADVDRLQAQLLPVLAELNLGYYLLERGPCRILEYSRGYYSDPDCEEMTPFDAQAAADFDKVTVAIQRSRVAVERIQRDYKGDVYLQLPDSSWQYNYYYVLLATGSSPPPKFWPEDEWTRIRGDWWFYRAHDD